MPTVKTTRSETTPTTDGAGETETVAPARVGETTTASAKIETTALARPEDAANASAALPARAATARPHEIDVEAEAMDVHHEATAVFERLASGLEDLLTQVRAYARARGVHGRRLARLATIVEDAVLHARRGAHEARYGQEDGRS